MTFSPGPAGASWVISLTKRCLFNSHFFAASRHCALGEVPSAMSASSRPVPSTSQELLLFKEASSKDKLRGHRLKRPQGHRRQLPLKLLNFICKAIASLSVRGKALNQPLQRNYVKHSLKEVWQIPR